MLPITPKSRAALAISAILAVVFLAACATTQAPANSDVVNPVSVGVAPAFTETIEAETTYAAVVQPKEQVDLSPMSSGRIHLMAVDVGSQVSQGQLIAELDNAVIESLLLQSQATLRDAEAKLASAKAALGPKQANAQARLDSALTAQEQLTNPSTTSLQSAQSAVSTAQSNLNSSKLKLELLLSPSAPDLQAFESAVATAQSNLDSATTRQDQLLNPSAADVHAAQGRVATAESRLDSKQTALDQLLNPTAATTAAAQESVSDAYSKLSSAQVAVNNAIITAPIDPDLKTNWDSLLAARLAEQSNTAILLNPALNAALSQTELDVIQKAILGDQERIALQMAKITSESVIPEVVNSALLVENSAQTAWDTAQEELKELQSPLSNIVDAARNYVTAEQAVLDSTLADLEQLQNADENSLTLAQNEVLKAGATLASARADLAALQDPSATSIALAQADVDSSQASFDAATANLALLTSPKDADLAAAKSLVAAAREGYAMTQPPLSDYALEVAQAAVDKAQAQLTSATRQVEDLNIVAPFDGVVTHRFLAPGAMASAQVPVAAMASSQVVVVLRVEETAVNSLNPGHSVVFTSPGLPGRELELVVDRVSPAGDEQSFTFLVMLNLVMPNPTGDEPELKAGMSGQVAITTRLENVVLVPKAAILRQGGQPAVFVVEGDTARLKLVGIGLTDENSVEIRTGIRTGEQVVVSGHNLLNEGDTVLIKSEPTAEN